ncbi:Aminoglycoside N(6')-acetyltransferase type 1 [Vibrio aerogenes CECT 7868]|uniref:Aminoglycoside N(6')-acetyltransferase type 1 n=1 Tax=Vibrio aerogenes CECT 7868 TaxID=1216006 RepID=A0A1M5XQP3_9VIBR|nr:GNAT family N-acetyltransferase [Vibrio aerogenes]SHI01854.1 Aminoglycoside N(6')-acetyltransferase type 1 [Vibrio aerogenes CECT 7868]
MPTTFIRFGCTEDLVHLEKLMYDLHDEHHVACPEHFKTAGEVMKEKQINDYLNSPEALVFIASHDDVVVGFITGHFSELVSMVSKPVLMGSIDELFVSPKFRSQGIGRQLLDRLMREFEDYGIEQIFVEVWAFNQAAQKLYQQLGFDHHIHWLRKAVK